jgi:hypothetical protein
VYTRHGRSFFADPAGELAFLAKLHAALSQSNFWDRFQTTWAIFDGEIMPWNEKAGGILETVRFGLLDPTRTVLRETLTHLRRGQAAGLNLGNWPAWAVGQEIALDVLVLNRRGSPIEVPLGLARAAIVYGPAESDDAALPASRAPREADLVTVGPAGLESVRLVLPVRHAGLARIVVALENDAWKLDGHVGVWTGSERFVGYVEVRPVEPGSAPERLRREARESASRPDTVDRLCAEVAALAKAQPDDRAVVPLSLVAVDATDARVAHAALAALEDLVANGGGVDAYGAFAPVAADPARPRDLRLRAVDGLARLAKGRIVSRTDVGAQMREFCDLPIPRRVVDHVRARLEALAIDPDVLVAERARAALGR